MRASRTSLLTRLGLSATAVALAATAGLTTASAAGAATTHPRRLPTTLSIRTRAVANTDHKSHRITGVLRSHRVPLRGKTVLLESRTAGHKFAVAAHAKTGVHGAVSFTVTPTVRTLYVLVFKGTPNFRHSRSMVIVLRVHKS